jgi:hypothetical protein
MENGPLVGQVFVDEERSVYPVSAFTLRYPVVISSRAFRTSREEAGRLNIAFLLFN